MQDGPTIRQHAAGPTRRLRVAALIGDRSPFGQAVLRALFESPDADVTLLVVPSPTRWNAFARTLAGPEYDTPEPTPLARMSAVMRLADPSRLLQEFGERTVRALEGFATRRNGGTPPAFELPAGMPPPMQVHDANEASVIERVRAMDIDVVLVGAFPQKLSAAWSSLPTMCALNVHPSALPRGRGANPIWWTIAAREREAGCTVHRLAAEFDVGDVLVQSRRELGPEVDYQALYDWSIDEARSCVARALSSLARGEATWSAQDESRASVYREPRVIHRKIHWESDTSEEIVGKVVAGRAFVVKQGTPMVVTRARALPPARFMTNGLRCAPGTVLGYDASTVRVRTVDGVVELAGLTVFGWRVDIRRAVSTVGARFE